jgi:hypothetical protein
MPFLTKMAKGSKSTNNGQKVHVSIFVEHGIAWIDRIFEGLKALFGLGFYLNVKNIMP